MAPLLVVELSCITSSSDRNTTKAHYERLGVCSYWLLNPVQPGELEVHELDEQDHYQLTVKATRSAPRSGRSR